MRAPAHWWRERANPAAQALAPVAALYAMAASRRLRATAPRANMAVICVGNPTVGGVGKTPVAMALARAALRLGLRPGFLTRGYARGASGAVAVDPARHGAAEVGDEPLLLATLAPTVVDAERARGARLLRELGCDLAIMDDGFQSRRLEPDLALLLVDGARGIGNGRVLPAGPLRAPLDAQLARADAVGIIDTGRGTARARARLGHWIERGGRTLEIAIEPRDGARFAGRDIVAFSGVGDPQRFRAMLAAQGARTVASRDFPDHHAFTEADIRELRALAAHHAAPLVTTAKDAVRLNGRDLPHEVLEIEARVPDADALLREALGRFAARRDQDAGG